MMDLDFKHEYINVPECETEYKWSDKVVITEEDYNNDHNLQMGILNLPSDTVALMLNALPEGIKWNPYTDRFEGKW